GASVTRMATLSEQGRITLMVVEEEIARLQRIWGAQPARSSADQGREREAASLFGAQWQQIDRFDQVQLAEVIAVCRASRSLSEAGRTLFQASRERKQSSNDADRLRKYLGRFGLSFEGLRDQG
ncbi:MAG: sigma 54-dependent transcriptional regulator, partial [Xanthomonadales bacterium]|nr:sigma 54-dependent transcriptional regulator [Xanthomonadales bacterium]